MKIFGLKFTRRVWKFDKIGKPNLRQDDLGQNDSNQNHLENTI